MQLFIDRLYLFEKRAFFVLLVIKDSLENLFIFPLKKLTKALRQKVICFKILIQFTVEKHIIVKVPRKIQIEILNVVH